MPEIGQLRHRCRIYQEVNAQAETGRVTQEPELIKTRWCRLTNRTSGEQAVGGSVEGFTQEYLEFRYDADLTALISSGCYFVLELRHGDVRYEASGPAVDLDGTYRFARVPVIRAVAEVIP